MRARASDQAKHKQSSSLAGNWGCLALAQEESHPTSKVSSAHPERLIANFYSHGYNLGSSSEVPEWSGYCCQFQILDPLCLEHLKHRRCSPLFVVGMEYLPNFHPLLHFTAIDHTNAKKLINHMAKL